MASRQAGRARDDADVAAVEPTCRPVPHMTKALLLSEHYLDGWQALYATGEVPSPLPYGVNVLGSVGWALSGARRTRSRIGVKLRNVVEHRLGFPVEPAVRGAFGAHRADVVLALLERQGMAAALWKRAGLPPYAGTPLVVWSCWLADDIRRADADERRSLRRRIEAIDLITHLSRHETEIFLDLGVPEERLYAVTYGVSHQFYVPPAPDDVRDLEVLAVGQDRGRDYGTLFEAVRGTDLQVDVVCKPDNVAGLDVPAERAAARTGQPAGVSRPAPSGPRRGGPDPRPVLPDRRQRGPRGVLDGVLRRGHRHPLDARPCLRRPDRPAGRRRRLRRVARRAGRAQ